MGEELDSLKKTQRASLKMELLEKFSDAPASRSFHLPIVERLGLVRYGLKPSAYETTSSGFTKLVTTSWTIQREAAENHQKRVLGRLECYKQELSFDTSKIKQEWRTTIPVFTVEDGSKALAPNTVDDVHYRANKVVYDSDKALEKILDHRTHLLSSIMLLKRKSGKSYSSELTLG